MTMSNEARPLLRDLREKVNETVHLAVLDGSEIMYVFNLESTQAIRMRSDVGVRKPAYCTAEGQAILAFQPADGARARGARWAEPAHAADHHRSAGAEKGARSRAAPRLRHRRRESELGMRCIAAPLRNDAGEVVAAIGLAGPVSRLSKKALPPSSRTSSRPPRRSRRGSAIAGGSQVVIAALHRSV
jgi:DNA-binding IclR family transcriptional regulator